MVRLTQEFVSVKARAWFRSDRRPSSTLNPGRTKARRGQEPGERTWARTIIRHHGEGRDPERFARPEDIGGVGGASVSPSSALAAADGGGRRPRSATPVASPRLSLGRTDENRKCSARLDRCFASLAAQRKQISMLARSACGASGDARRRYEPSPRPSRAWSSLARSGPALPEQTPDPEQTEYESQDSVFIRPERRRKVCRGLRPRRTHRSFLAVSQTFRSDPELSRSSGAAWRR
jgi:hypothetical protein